MDIINQIKDHQTQIKRLRQLLKAEQKAQKSITIPDTIDTRDQINPNPQVENDTTLTEFLVRFVSELPDDGKCSINDLQSDDPRIKEALCQNMQNVVCKGLLYRNHLRPEMIKRFKKVTFVSRTNTLHWRK